MTQPYLQCEDLCKRFGSTVALDGFSVALTKGQVLALLGPSGCGKTTALNILQGLLRPDSGCVRCDDQTIDDPAAGTWLPMRDRRFATVFQDFSLWPHMTVAANVAYGLRVQGIPRSEREQRTAEALRLVGLESMAGRRPSQLSGGQQQRVAIARAVVVRPRVLLLDEPLSALDARLREELRDDLALLLRESGCTAVYVTHDQSEAFALADLVAVMNKGRIEQLGSPGDLYHSPRTRFVASFIGSSNILDAASQHELNIEHRSTLLLRREAVTIHPGVPEDSSTGTVRGTCERSHFLGDRCEVAIRISPTLSLRGIATLPITPGTPAYATFDLSAARPIRE